MDALTFAQDNWDQILSIGAALWALVSLIVALTPTQDDDKWLASVAVRFSFLKPRDQPGVLSLPGILPRAPDNRDLRRDVSNQRDPRGQYGVDSEADNS